MTTPSAHRFRHLLLGVLALGGASLIGCRQVSPYDFCFTNADCMPGLTCQAVSSGDRICTTSCSATNPCPANARGVDGTCVSFDGGTTSSCLETCSATVRCATGFVCTDADSGPETSLVCLPSRTAASRPYASCTEGGGCGSGTECFSVNTAGARMCTRSCGSAADCPTDAFGAQARCMSFDGTNFECYQACNISQGGRECEGSFGCFDSDGSGRTFPPICLPR